MLAGHSHKLLEQSAKESIERIQLDRRKAPQRLKPLLAYIEENLFNPTLDVNQLKRSCGVRDNSVPIQFHSAVGRPPHGYIEDRRLETACRLLADTHLKIWQISELLGYSSIQVFSRAFSRWSGQRPTLFRKKARRGADVDMGDSQAARNGRARFDRSVVATESLRKALDGELPAEEATLLIDTLKDLYPASEPSEVSDAPEVTDDPTDGGAFAPELVNDASHQDAESAQLRGNAHDQYQAETIWSRLDGAVSDHQQAILAETTLTSAALFYLLLEKSREIGREDAARGVAIAELALSSLEAVGRRPGDQQSFASLVALGWVRLATARSLASDLEGAEAGFGEAERFLEVSGRRPNIETEILVYKASLRREQRRFAEARELLDRAQALCPPSENDLLAKALLTQASVRFEEADPNATIPFLEQALPLTAQSKNMLLRLAVYHNLVAAYSESSLFDKAVDLMPVAKRLSSEHGTGYNKIRFRWLEGLVARGLGELDRAEQALVESRDAFSESGDALNTGLVCLDLAELFSRQGRYADLISLCSSMAPLNGMLQKHPEAIVALQLFQRSAEERSVTSVIVERARKALLRSQKRVFI